MFSWQLVCKALSGRLALTFAFADFAPQLRGDGPRGKPECSAANWRADLNNPPPRPRRPTSAIERAEAVFKPAAPAPAAPAAKTAAIPSGKEAVSLRLDRDVLAFFQEDGPGWQERINEALRRVAGV